MASTTSTASTRANLESQAQIIIQYYSMVKNFPLTVNGKPPKSASDKELQAFIKRYVSSSGLSIGDMNSALSATGAASLGSKVAGAIGFIPDVVRNLVETGTRDQSYDEQQQERRQRERYRQFMVDSGVLPYSSPTRSYLNRPGMPGFSTGVRPEVPFSNGGVSSPLQPGISSPGGLPTRGAPTGYVASGAQGSGDSGMVNPPISPPVSTGSNAYPVGGPGTFPTGGNGGGKTTTAPGKMTPGTGIPQPGAGLGTLPGPSSTDAANGLEPLYGLASGTGLTPNGLAQVMADPNLFADYMLKSTTGMTSEAQQAAAAKVAGPINQLFSVLSPYGTDPSYPAKDNYATASDIYNTGANVLGGYFTPGGQMINPDAAIGQILRANGGYNSMGMVGGGTNSVLESFVGTGTPEEQVQKTNALIGKVIDLTMPNDVYAAGVANLFNAAGEDYIKATAQGYDGSFAQYLRGYLPDTLLAGDSSSAMKAVDPRATAIGMAGGL